MSWIKKNRWPKKLGLLLVDAALVSGGLYLALALRYEQWWNLEFTNTYSHIIEILCIYMATFVLGKLYEILWRYAGIFEAARVSLLCAIAAVISIAFSLLLRWSISRAVLCLLGVLTLLLVVGVRILWRVVMNKRRATERFDKSTTSPRLMIVGGGMAGSYVLNMCRNDPGLGTPVIFADDDPMKQKLRVQGVLVAGNIDDVPRLATQYDIQDIIIAIPSLKGTALNKVVEKCKETSCRVRISSKIQDSDGALNPNNLFVRELNISDFLSRDEVHLDTMEIAAYLSGRTVLVTGGGGSIGSELARQIMKFKPKQLVIFDIYENCVYELQCELKQLYGADCPVHVLIGSVRDKERVKEVFDQIQPEVVFHAAAHKHVPLMEDSPAEAVKNNVFGTLNVLEAADAHRVQRFVLLSTDKAVNPTNVMGATKRITEMLIQYYAGKSDMKCMAVRFGNVLGSHGSVIPLFEKQIKAGGPVTVTDKNIERFFMTIPEAAQLVLQAGSIAKSGSIFVLDMGKAVKIDELARQLIRFYGYEPDVNMSIAYTGLRPGEKLYEELLTGPERNAMQKTQHEKIMIAPPIPQDTVVFERQLQTLAVAAEHNDQRVVDVIRVVVPTYHEGGQAEAKVG